jgi:arylsulfatase A-like enzyme
MCSRSTREADIRDDLRQTRRTRGAARTCPDPAKSTRGERPGALLLGTAVVLFLIASGCSLVEDHSAPGNVLLITIDTLRADHVGHYGYERSTTPVLDEFFASGRSYRNAYATASYTPPSVVSMLSGRLPPEHGVFHFFQLVDEDLQLICDLLPAHYETAAFVSNAILTRDAIGIDRCFDFYDDYVDEIEGSVRRIWERSARRTTEAAIRWLRSGREPDRNIFLWVHYIDPHGPYSAPPEASVSFDHEGERPVDRSRIPLYVRESTDDALDYIDRYDEEIAYADAEVGRLLAAWKQISEGDRDLVIFTADHGESLVDRDVYFEHGFHVFEELIRIPFSIRGPGVEVAAADEVVSLVDVLPTILAFVGAEAPEALPGTNLLAKEPPASDRMVYAESPRWSAVVQGRRKWIAKIEGQRNIAKGQVYDLESDPREERPAPWDLEDPGPVWLAELATGDRRNRPGGAKWRKGVIPTRPRIAPRVSEDQLERLRGLGYVE